MVNRNHGPRVVIYVKHRSNAVDEVCGGTCAFGMWVATKVIPLGWTIAASSEKVLPWWWAVPGVCCNIHDWM